MREWQSLKKLRNKSLRAENCIDPSLKEDQSFILSSQNFRRLTICTSSRWTTLSTFSREDLSDLKSPIFWVREFRYWSMISPFSPMKMWWKGYSINTDSSLVFKSPQELNSKRTRLNSKFMITFWMEPRFKSKIISKWMISQIIWQKVLTKISVICLLKIKNLRAF